MKTYIVCIDGDYKGTIIAENELEAQKRANQIFPNITDDELLIVEEER